VAYLKSRGTFESDVVVMVLNSTDPLQTVSTYVEGDLNYPMERPTLALTELVGRYVLPRISNRFVVQEDAGSRSRPNDSIDNQPEVLAAIGEAQTFVAARGGRFAVAYVPFRNERAPQFAQAYEVLKAWCTAHGTPFIDLKQEIESYPETYTHLDGSHLRPEGHALVAHRFEREIQAVLAGAAAPGVEHAPVVGTALGQGQPKP
jgi:hypothetical protein